MLEQQLLPQDYPPLREVSMCLNEEVYIFSLFVAQNADSSKSPVIGCKVSYHREPENCLLSARITSITNVPAEM